MPILYSYCVLGIHSSLAWGDLLVSSDRFFIWKKGYLTGMPGVVYGIQDLTLSGICVFVVVYVSLIKFVEYHVCEETVL